MNASILSKLENYSETSKLPLEVDKKGSSFIVRGESYKVNDESKYQLDIMVLYEPNGRYKIIAYERQGNNWDPIRDIESYIVKEDEVVPAIEKIREELRCYRKSL